MSDPSADCSDCARLSPDSDHAAQRDADATVLSGQAGDVNWVLQRLQSVFNAAARLVFSARKSEHITPLLRELHWLKVPERNQFRLCLLAYHCLIGTAPSFQGDRCVSADIRSVSVEWIYHRHRQPAHRSISQPQQAMRLLPT